jgi:hypothetical protein
MRSISKSRRQRLHRRGDRVAVARAEADRAALARSQAHRAHRHRDPGAGLGVGDSHRADELEVGATLLSTSAMPKRPKAPATNSISRSETVPNVKRWLPVTGSRPIVPRMRPTIAIISAFTSEPPVALLTTTNPNTVSEKNSGAAA